MKKIILVIACTALFNCGKKVESVPVPTNSQITDAVTQTVQPVEAVDAGVLVAPAVVQPVTTTAVTVEQVKPAVETKTETK